MSPAISILSPPAPNPERMPREPGVGADPARSSRPFESFAAGFQETRIRTEPRPAPAHNDDDGTTSNAPGNADSGIEAGEPAVGRRPGRRAETVVEEEEPESLPWANALLLISQPSPRTEVRLTGTASEPPEPAEVGTVAASPGEPGGDSLLSLSARDTLNDAALSPLPAQFTEVTGRSPHIPPQRELRTRRNETAIEGGATALQPSEAPSGDEGDKAGGLILDKDWTAAHDAPLVSVLPHPSAPTQSLRAAGTAAAQLASDMKEQLQREEIAGSRALSPSARQGMAGNVPSGLRKTGSELVLDRIREKEFSPTATFLDGNSSVTNGLGPDSVESLPRLEPVRDLAPVIHEQVIHLRRAGLESMEVVLRPDRGTELHLQLTQQAGQIEVQIRCDRGNRDQLNAGWSKLQESLAQQGIRLAPLDGGSMASGGDQFSRQQGSPRQPQNPSDWLIPAPILPTVSRPLSATSTSAAPRRPVVGPQRVLESWA